MGLQLAGETQRGFEYLRDIIQSGKMLRLGEPQRAYGSGSSFLLPVTGLGKSYELYLTRENLDDLPGTKEHREAANHLARALDKRFNNVDPNLFMTKSGRLLRIQIEWPFQPWLNEQFQMTAASVVLVIVTDHIQISDKRSCPILGLLTLKRSCFTRLSRHDRMSVWLTSDTLHLSKRVMKWSIIGLIFTHWV